MRSARATVPLSPRAYLDTIPRKARSAKTLSHLSSGPSHHFVSKPNETKRNETSEKFDLFMEFGSQTWERYLCVRHEQGNRCSGNGTREKGSRKRIDEIGNAGIREENPC